MRALAPSLNSVMINERDECEYVALGNILHTNKNILYFPPQCKNLAPPPLHMLPSVLPLPSTLSWCHRRCPSGLVTTFNVHRRHCHAPEKEGKQKQHWPVHQGARWMTCQGLCELSSRSPAAWCVALLSQTFDFFLEKDSTLLLRKQIRFRYRLSKDS